MEVAYRNGITSDRTWDGGIVPYRFSPELSASIARTSLRLQLT